MNLVFYFYISINCFFLDIRILTCTVPREKLLILIFSKSLIPKAHRSLPDTNQWSPMILLM